MESLASFILFIFFFTHLSLAQLLPIVNEDDQRVTYMVYVARPDGAGLLDDEELESWHLSFLPNTTLASGEPRLMYSYQHAMSGFAAALTGREVRAMESVEGFLYARPAEQFELATTYTPELLGLNDFGGPWSRTFMGEGVIIGVIDTGILPTHPSFNDSDMPPAPSYRWNATCAANFPCNNKIIGAKAFYKSKNPSPIDTVGHGTHVAGIAAGSVVEHASVLGRGTGTASGVAPKAHLAIYKVCFETCDEADTTAGIDQAIKDGVDVLSMSIVGKQSKLDFLRDYIASNSYGAVAKGIPAVTAAGNNGYAPSTLGHDAPWVLTVGASTTDRRIVALVKLGNGEVLDGESAYQPYSFDSSTPLRLVYPGVLGDPNATFCQLGSLDTFDLRGSIVLCSTGGDLNNIEKGMVVRHGGGAAMILMNRQDKESYTTSADAHVIPTSHISYMNGRKVLNYLYSSLPFPNATIVFNATQFGYRPSPAVASFSSRGPGLNNGGILKPDVLAPGANILSAWHVGVGPNPPLYPHKTFNFDSGTSMAAPHVAGVVALIKKEHPGWSPAMITSAIVTSAIDRDRDGNLIRDEGTNLTSSVFARGAGQLNPAGAMDPGLVYDLKTKDYPGYLCGLGYPSILVTILTKSLVDCAKEKRLSAAQLNYPSFAAKLRSATPTLTLERTVKNVGEPNSIYWASITEPAGVEVDLSTYRLHFTRTGEEKSFNVTLKMKSPGPGVPGLRAHVGGKLQWVLGQRKRVVTSPIAVELF